MKRRYIVIVKEPPKTRKNCKHHNLHKKKKRERIDPVELWTQILAGTVAAVIGGLILQITLEVILPLVFVSSHAVVCI